MITHSFEYRHNGKSHYFVFHPFSSSLHEVDYAAFLVIKHKYEALNECEKKDYDRLEKSLIEQIEGEVIEAEKRGVLGVDHTLKYNKSDIVKALCLHICHDCNLCCTYCFAGDGTYNTEKDYMSFEVGKAAVDFLIKNSGTRRNLEIDFFGGEPLMNVLVVKQIVEYAKSEGEKHGKTFSFTLTTNGVLLNEQNREFLNKEMYNVVISIDGRKEVHNLVRKTVNGKDCYDLILSNAQKFRKIRGDKQYFVRGTFTHNNLDFAKDVLALHDAGFDKVSLEPVVLDMDDPLAIKRSDTDRILEEYEVLAREYIKIRKADKDFEFFHFMIDLESSPCIRKRLTGCGAGCEYLAVSPVGDIYPCHQFVGKDEFLMGNVLSERLDKSIQQRFSDITVYKKKDCENCFAKYYCSGGCIAASNNYEKDLYTPYKPACDMMRKRLELSLAIWAIERLSH